MSTNHQAHADNPRQTSPPSIKDAELLRFVSRGVVTAAAPLAPASHVSLPAPPIAAMNPAAIPPFLAASQMVAPQPLPTESEAALAARVAAAARAGAAALGGDEFDEDDYDDGKVGCLTSLPVQRRPCMNRPIDHTYTDYAMISDAELRRLDQDSSVVHSPSLSPEKKSLMLKLQEMPPKSGCGAAQSFPIKLHQVLANSDLADIITWMPHGRCFIVLDSERLVDEVLPCYFNQSKILSFIRQLNLWGFKRLTRGVVGKAYYHELFLKDRPFLALRLKRHKVKGHGYKPIPNPAGEPNFYSYPHVGSLTTGSVSSSTKAQSPFEGNGPRSKKKILMDRAEVVTNKETFGIEVIRKVSVQKVAPNLLAAKVIVPEHQKPRSVEGMAVSLTRQPTLDARQSSTFSEFVTADAANRALPPASSTLTGLSGFKPAKKPNNLEGSVATAPLVDRRIGQAGLLMAGEFQYAALSGMYASRPMANVGDRLLEERLSLLQREKEQLENLRNARLVEDFINSNNMKSHMSGLVYSGGLNRNHMNEGHAHAYPASNGFGQSISMAAQASSAVSTSSLLAGSSSVSDSLREAKYYEEMANAARAKARAIALSGEVQVVAQSNFEN